MIRSGQSADMARAMISLVSIIGYCLAPTRPPSWDGVCAGCRRSKSWLLCSLRRKRNLADSCHEGDFARHNRRDFLRASSLLALAPTVPVFLVKTASASTQSKDSRVLVVVQLDGG